ncbi:hypothetical protein U2S91_04315 [Stenotrophomonas maltophilia]|uniref:hypothetical protein n=1 Tax=Stenotrophomonas maltophilia TaxID=40324 RepID=UPI0013D977A6|nr:hypothetical protein [Stenotrophomonas maltophilia]ELF4101218.1 hypothetical protein [Stenotrophomonas maltophilia]WQI21876.1 hypothetical protein U2S91_04315 [Stenotrophomonas maltophilia]
MQLEQREGQTMDVGNVADWVGVAGSLLAIAVSVGLHRSSVTARKEVEVAQAKSAALQILPLLRAASREFSFARQALKDGRSPDAVGKDDSGPISVATLGQWESRLAQFLPTMAALGVNAHHVQRAFALIQSLHDDFYTYEEAPDAMPGDPRFVGERWPETQALLFAATEALETSVAELQRTVEGSR